MWLPEAMALELGKGGVRPIVLVRIATDPVARAWSGVGDLALAADDVETTDGAIYRGVGALLDLPAVEILTGMSAARVTLAVSGLSAEVLAMIESEAADIEGRAANFGIGLLNRRQQLVAPVFWKLTGEVEEILSDETRLTRSAGIQIAYGATDRRTPQYGYWSPAHQEALYPGDLGCSRTPLYDAGRDIVWPRW